MMRRHAIIGRRVGSFTPVTPPSGTGSLTYDSTLNIAIDGNSIIAGVGASQDPTRLLAQTYPIATTTLSISQTTSATALGNDPITGRTAKWQSNKGVYLENCGVSGQTWRKMNGLDGGSTADIDGFFVVGKVNVLIGWEGTNSIAGGRTAAQAIQDATDWLAARKAAHPWSKAFTGTCLPRMDSTTDQSIVDANNAAIDQYNALLRANYQSMGFDGIFDVRQSGSPFNLSDYLIATFNASAAQTNSIWSSETTHIHPSSTGNDYIVRSCMMPMLIAA